MTTSRDLDVLSKVRSGSFIVDERPAMREVRVIAWNIRRGKSIRDWLAVPELRNADILLLTELDVGMARSGNLDVPRELARALGFAYAFAPSFLELTRGTPAERRATRGRENEQALHGNAVLSRWPFLELERVALPPKFRWDLHEEKRVGTRVGLIARIGFPGASFHVVSSQLEVFTTPEDRAEQLRALLFYLRGAPAIVAGDLNTLGAYPSWKNVPRVATEWWSNRRRLVDPVSREPLFGVCARDGFTWSSSNVEHAPTWSAHPLAPRACRAKLDWFLVRDLSVVRESAQVIPVPRGLSDHDGIAVTIER